MDSDVVLARLAMADAPPDARAPTGPRTHITSGECAGADAGRSGQPGRESEAQNICVGACERQSARSDAQVGRR